MLQYDLTNTALSNCISEHPLPMEAETFAITAALLVTHGAAYSDLRDFDLELTDEGLEDVAVCFEQRLPSLGRYIGTGWQLRQRLRVFVGLKISDLSASDLDECREPT